MVWKKELKRPDNAHVSNNGVVAVKNSPDPNFKKWEGSLFVFDSSGNKLMEKEFDDESGLIGVSDISPDGKYVVVTRNPPDNFIYMFNVKTEELMWKYKNHSPSSDVIL